MIIFLISAVLSFAVVNLLLSLHIDDDKYRQTRTYSKPGFELTIQNAALIKCAGILIVILLGLAVYLAIGQIMKPHSSLYSALDLLTGQLFNRLAVGVLFGTLAAVWLRRLYLKEGDKSAKDDAQPLKQKVKKTTTGSDGSVSEETIDVFDENRSGASAEGWRLSAVEIVEGAILLILFIIGTTPFTITDLISGVKVDSPVVKFQLQSQNNTLSTNFAQDAAAVSSKLSNSKSGDRKDPDFFNPYYLNAVQGMMARDANYIRLQNKCEPDDSKKPSEQETPVSLEGQNTAGQLNCRQAGGIIRFSELLPRYQDFSACLARSAFANGDRRLFQEIIRKLAIPLNRLHSISIAEQGSVGGGRVETGSGSTLQAAFKSLDEIISGETKQLEDFLALNGEASDCTQNSKSYDQVDWDKFTRIQNRPYFTIIYASSLALDKQYKAALGILEFWLSDYAKASNSLDDPKSPEFWLNLRALSIKSTIFEAWIRDSDHGTISQALLEEHLSDLGQYIKILKRIPAILNRDEYVRSPNFDGIPNRVLESVGFQRMPKIGECKLPLTKTDGLVIGPAEGRKLNLRLLTVYYQAQAVYARRAIQHFKYETSLSQPTKDMISSLVNSDLSCIKEFLDNPRTPGRYEGVVAESLRIYGLSKIQEVRLRNSSGSNYREWLRSNLEQASGSFRLALTFVEDSARKKKTVRRERTDYQKYNVSPEEWLQDELRQWIDRLGAIQINLQ